MSSLPNEAMIYDISNACLGLLNGIVQVASMIELGQIRAGVVVGTECGRELVENTIELLNADTTLTRESVKNSIASLTIGSASVAIVLCDEELSQTGNRLTTAAAYCDTSQHDLCQSRGLKAIMQTDSEELMRQGIAAGVQTFDRFLAAAGWEPDDIDRSFCHQVGAAHRKLMLESLGLKPQNDFATLETLGNTGSAALPITMALGVEQGRLRADDRVAMLGIGSGINCLMLAVEWQKSAAVKPVAEFARIRSVTESRTLASPARAVPLRTPAASATAKRCQHDADHDDDRHADRHPQNPSRSLARRHVVRRLQRIKLGSLRDFPLHLFHFRIVQLFFQQRPRFSGTDSRLGASL